MTENGWNRRECKTQCGRVGGGAASEPWAEVRAERGGEKLEIKESGKEEKMVS